MNEDVDDVVDVFKKVNEIVLKKNEIVGNVVFNYIEDQIVLKT